MNYANLLELFKRRFFVERQYLDDGLRKEDAGCVILYLRNQFTDKSFGWSSDDDMESMGYITKHVNSHYFIVTNAGLKHGKKIYEEHYRDRLMLEML